MTDVSKEEKLRVLDALEKKAIKYERQVLSSDPGLRQSVVNIGEAWIQRIGPIVEAIRADIGGCEHFDRSRCPDCGTKMKRVVFRSVPMPV